MAARKQKLNLDKMTVIQHSNAQANRNNRPFLRLPGEIRNLLYGYALGGHELRQTRTGPTGEAAYSSH
ncbi:hypothetical protein DPSP01_008233 [Paraphaeosphaeria sporulosa]